MKERQTILGKGKNSRALQINEMTDDEPKKNQCVREERGKE